MYLRAKPQNIEHRVARKKGILLHESAAHSRRWMLSFAQSNTNGLSASRPYAWHIKYCFIKNFCAEASTSQGVINVWWSRAVTYSQACMSLCNTFSHSDTWWLCWAEYLRTQTSVVVKNKCEKIYFLVSNNTAERRGNVRPREEKGCHAWKISSSMPKNYGMFW